MLLQILTEENPQLREKSAFVKGITAETKKLIANMIETMNYGDRAVGLAAPQVGIKQRIIVCKIKNSLGKYINMALINPEVLRRSQACELGEEGCLSIPNIFGPVMRAKDITIQFTTEDKKIVIKRFSGYNARVIQHEIDHLDGVLFTDLIGDKSLIYEELSY